MTTLIRADIVERVAEILEEIAGVNPSDVAEDKKFGDDLDVDDLSMVEVIVTCEEIFDVKVPDWDDANIPFKTVGELVGFIEKAQL